MAEIEKCYCLSFIDYREALIRFGNTMSEL